MNLRRETMYSWPNGSPYKIWTRERLRVPRIQASILDCAVYLYPSREAALEGAASGGSGFLLAVPSYSPEPLNPDSEEELAAIRQTTAGKSNSSALERYHLYLVTNYHVAYHELSPCKFARINARSGSPTIMNLESAQWVTHDDYDDISVCPIHDMSEWENGFRAVSMYRMVTKSQADDLWVGPGDDVFMVGRLLDYDGSQNSNWPSVRFGHIAMMPQPVKHPCGLHMESYLVEMSSFSGYSGSPVFLNIQPWEVRPNDRTQNQLFEETWIIRRLPKEGTGQSLWLLGINWGHLPISMDASIEDGSSVIRIKANAGVAAVSPAWKILDVLNHANLAKLRAADRERWASEGAAILD